MNIYPFGFANGQGQRPGARSGVHLVEFAVVAPLFFLFVLALVELGRGLMVTHLLTSAARKGCRAAIISGRSTSDVSATVQNALAGQGITGYSTTVQVNGAGADAVTAGSGDAITVIVSVPMANVSWLPGLGLIPGNLSGSYSLRRE